jgi:hypothetical protein
VIRRFSKLWLPLAGLILLALAGAAEAATTPKTPPGITVSPATQQVTLAASDSAKTLDFKITNNKASAQSLQISTADFNALEETGGLVFVGSNPTALQKKYGLAKWVTLPQPNLTIPAHQTVDARAQIQNLPDLAAGGHYGAIMLHLAGTSPANAKNLIGLKPIASILLFVNKSGGDIHRLKLADVNAKHSLFSLPDSVTLRFYNSGNTHVTPRGTVSLLDPDGKLVSRGVINENSGLVLPEVYRRYSVKLSSVANSSKVGHYKLNVAFRFDGLEQFRFYQTSFVFLAPSAVVIGVVFLLVIIGLLVYALRARKLAIVRRIFRR